jgi:drug/metabolite transporter (DMT)-like permease
MPALGWGDLLTLGAVLCYGLQVALLDHWAKHHDPLALTCVQISVLAVIFLLIWPPTDRLAFPPSEVWFPLLLTALVATSLGLLVQVLAQQRLSAVRCAMIFTLEPVFAALFGYLCSGDRLSLTQWAGAVLMVLAVLLAETDKA